MSLKRSPNALVTVIFLQNLKNSINFSSLNCLTWSYLFYRIEPYLFQVLFDLENLTRKRKDAFWDAGQPGSGNWWPARRTSGSRPSSRSRPAPTSWIVEQHLRFSLNSILLVRLISLNICDVIIMKDPVCSVNWFK